MTTRPSASIRRSGPLLIGVAVLATLLCGGALVAGALLLGAVSFGDTDQDDVAPAVIENVARLRLPAKAYDLRSHLEGFQDRLIFVRFRMPPSELPAFERSLSCALGPPLPAPHLHAGPRPDWFTQAKLARSCQGQGPGFHQSVTVDVSAGDLVVQVTVIES
jgi:hypothetical protein